jgi:exodeoxyribonuclease V alpha subunit
MTMATTPRPRDTAAPAAPLPDAAPTGIADYVAARVVTPNDLAAIAILLDMARRETPALQPELRAWVAMGLALRAPRDGHTCVDFSDVAAWSGDLDLAQAERPDWPETAAPWIDSLASAEQLVGTPGSRSPFILDGARLFIARAFHEEQEIARRLVGKGADRIRVLLGGPGTGKTTRVATQLIGLFRDDPDALIALAAPTGKAAARMAEALRLRLQDDKAPDEIRNAPQHVRDKVAQVRPLTIHKLLDYRPHRAPRYGINASKKIACSIVVVDEASMLSSSLMYHLLAGLGDDTQLLLVGDPNQLASVDAGTVLGDIAAAAATSGSPLASRTETLRIRHRFGPRIGALADAILAGDEQGVTRAFGILEGRWTPPRDAVNTKADDPRSVRWIEPGSAAFADVVEEVVTHAALLRDLVKQGRTDAALAARRKLQVLCAHRTGGSGVAGWNQRVERRLGVEFARGWYAGRPLMVIRNNPALDLFNGDMGLVVPGENDGLRDVAFPTAEGPPRRVAVSRLEAVETAHALTIHKSQGSEYEHAIVILPEKPSRIVSRELLYTGVTRASERVTLVGSRAVIEAAIGRPIRRATGLAERLKGGLTETHLPRARGDQGIGRG